MTSGTGSKEKKEKNNRKPLGESIENKLMTFIIDEPINVGSKLPNEFELAERFGVSRSTIREVVKSLCSKGILDVRRGSGTYVVSRSIPVYDPLGISQQEDKYSLALDLCDVRLMLEPKIAAKAAVNATDEERIRLREVCDEVEKLYIQNKNHIPKDTEFHTLLATCSKNRVVESLIPIIQNSVAAFANITHETLKRETLETHRAIVQAVFDRDPDGAEYAMMMHLNYTRQQIMKLKNKKKVKDKSKLSDDYAKLFD